MSDHRDSLRRKMAQPRGLSALLSWFVHGFRDEVPDELHSGGVWRDRKRRGDRDDYAPVGGSLLGTPRTSPGAEGFIEDSPHSTEVAAYDGQQDRDTSYRYPMRAALATLAGRGPLTETSPYMARFLYLVALNDGDWESVSTRCGIPAQVAPIWTEQALYSLWVRYDSVPPNRALPNSEVA